MNPDCRKIYDKNDKDADTDYCSFSCWEKVNCLEPTKTIFEDLVIVD
jgi:hypothetical protein